MRVARVKEELTSRQKEILRFIRRYIRTRGLPPALRDLCEEFGFKVDPARRHVLALERKGHIRRYPGVARGIRVL